MGKQLVCPIRGNKCLEENCGWWVEAGAIEKTKSDEGQRTTYTPVGCCSIKAIALRKG